MSQPPIADLCDALGDRAKVLPGPFQRFTGVESFHGPIELLQLEGRDQALKDILSTPGHNRVALVKVLGEAPVAVFGDGMAQLAEANGWAGVVILGHVRDAALIAPRKVGVLARGTYPRIARDGAHGLEVPRLTIDGVTFQRGEVLVADADGVIVVLADALD